MPRKQSNDPRQEILPPESDLGTDVVLITPQSAELVLQDPEEFEKLFARVKAETEKLKPDVTTHKGREAIRSMTRKVVTTKTTIDKARLLLTKNWRDLVSSTNDQGKVIETKLEELAAEVRAPLTAYEDAEKARENRRNTVMAAIVELRQIAWDDDSQLIGERIERLDALQISDSDWGDDITTIINRVNEARETLTVAKAKVAEAEQSAAELARLREAEAARVAEAEQEALALAAREREAREAEEEKQREADRIELAKREAAAEANRAAEIEKARVQAEHEAALKAERDKAAAIESAAQAERDRIAKEKAEADAKAAAEVEAQRLRDEDRAHQSSVLRAAKDAIMAECGIDEESAKKVVLAIRGGLVPNITLRF